MSDGFENAVRYHGANYREHVAKIYLANGNAFGEEVVRRILWEIVDHATEVHGPTVAQDMLRSALEGLQLDIAPPIAAPEDPGPDPIVAALEGVTTLQEQVRQTLAAVVVTLGTLATEVRAGRAS